MKIEEYYKIKVGDKQVNRKDILKDVYEDQERIIIRLEAKYKLLNERMGRINWAVNNQKETRESIDKVL